MTCAQIHLTPTKFIYFRWGCWGTRAHVRTMSDFTLTSGRTSCLVKTKTIVQVANERNESVRVIPGFQFDDIQIFQSRLPTSHHCVRNVRPRHAWSNSCSSWSRRVPSWYPRWVKPGLCPRILEPKNCKIETHWISYLLKIILRIHPIYTMTWSPWEKEQLSCFPWLLEVGRSASMPRNSAPVPEPLVGVDPWVWRVPGVAYGRKQKVQ